MGSIRNKQRFYRQGLKAMSLIQQALQLLCRPLKAGAAIGPGDQGLWSPIVPPRPSIDEVEQRQRPQEEAGKLELQKTVKYEITYGVGE